jgi:hypothetical protein
MGMGVGARRGDTKHERRGVLTALHGHRTCGIIPVAGTVGNLIYALVLIIDTNTVDYHT